MEDFANKPADIPITSQMPTNGESSQQPGPMSTNGNTNQAQKTKNNTTPPSRNTIIFLSIISFLILVMVAMILFFPFSSLSRIQNSFTHGLFNTKNTESNKKSSITPTPAIGKNGIPLGRADTFGNAEVQGTTISVDNVIINPPVKGDPPDSGMQYLEIDLDVTYSGNTPGSVPGIFTYLDASGNPIPSVEKKGTDKSTYKNVSVPGKIPLYQLKLTKGATFKGVYLLYQIKPDDKGKLLWNYSYDPQKGYKHTFFVLFH